MAKRVPVLRTVKVMASELGVTAQRLRWLLKRHAEISPRALADEERVFDRAAFEQVKRLLGKVGRA
ncbi:MAG: hypothetical protein ABSE73_13240 [Planctomycetota bacterium]